MSGNDGSLEKNADLWALACKIAEHHAFEQHQADFNNPELGPVLNIYEVEKLAEHIYKTIIDRDTKCFRVDEGNQAGTHYAYNEHTNTFVVFSLPENERMPPTAYRPDNREKRFEAKHERASKEQQGREPEIKHGIHELLLDLEKERERDAKTEERTVEKTLQNKTPQREDAREATADKALEDRPLTIMEKMKAAGLIVERTEQEKREARERAERLLKERQQERHRDKGRERPLSAMEKKKAAEPTVERTKREKRETRDRAEKLLKKRKEARTLERNNPLGRGGQERER